MIAYLDKQSEKQDQKILCFYGNASNKIQILRLNNYWKKIVFPGEKLFFEGIASAELEIEKQAENGETMG